MADIKFACPTCQQHIQAEPAYSGLEIHCPSCKNKMMVPGTPISRAVPASAPPPVYAPAPPPPPPVTRAAPPTSPATNCPSCGAPLSRGGVLCTQCGFNVSTGKATATNRPAAQRKRAGASDSSTTPWIILGVVFAVVATLTFFGRTNPTMLMASGAVAGLFAMGVQIAVLIAAFQESTGTGFLTLCVPFYVFYFVYGVSGSKTLKILLAGMILVLIANQLLAFALMR